MNEAPTYDSYGRMKYHPDFHHNQGKPWTMKDQQYLIDYYEIIGPEQVSHDLGRTIQTVMTRAAKLRKDGQMPKRTSNIYHRRMRMLA